VFFVVSWISAVVSGVEGGGLGQLIFFGWGDEISLIRAIG